MDVVSFELCNDLLPVILLLNIDCRMKAVGFRQGFRDQVQMWRMGFEVLPAVAFSERSLSTAASRRSCAVKKGTMREEGLEV